MKKFSFQSHSEFSYALTNENIDAISQMVAAFCRDINPKDSKQIIRCRLSIEEALSVWLQQEKDPAEAKNVTVVTGFRLGKPFITIRYKGESFNPFLEQAEETGEYGYSFLTRLGINPEYSYQNQENNLKYNLRKKKKNPVFSFLTAIILAILSGYLTMYFLPADIIEGMLSGVLTPIYDTFFRLLRLVAGPMIFLSIVWGIYGIGDTATLNKMGKKMMLRYILVVFAASTVAACITQPVFGQQFSDSSVLSNQYADIFKMILDIVPDNIVEPFSEGNTLQIIFLGFMIGIALLFLGRKTKMLAHGFEQINYLVEFLMETISSIVPYAIFVILLKMIWEGTLENIRFIWIFFISTIIALVILLGGFIIITSIRHKVSPVILIKKIAPTIAIGITTASSAASFGTIVKTCQDKLGIDKSLTSFGVPMGIVMFKPGTAIYYTIICIFFSSIFEVDVSLSWIVSCIFIASVLAISTPPVPGGAAAAYAILFLQLGIPDFALGWALAVDVVFDFFTTTVNISTLELSLSGLARKFGKINEKILRREK